MTRAVAILALAHPLLYPLPHSRSNLILLLNKPGSTVSKQGENNILLLNKFGIVNRNRLIDKNRLLNKPGL